MQSLHLIIAGFLAATFHSQKPNSRPPNLPTRKTACGGVNEVDFVSTQQPVRLEDGKEKKEEI